MTRAQQRLNWVSLTGSNRVWLVINHESNSRWPSQTWSNQVWVGRYWKNHLGSDWSQTWRIMSLLTILVTMNSELYYFDFFFISMFFRSFPQFHVNFVIMYLQVSHLCRDFLLCYAPLVFIFCCFCRASELLLLSCLYFILYSHFAEELRWASSSLAYTAFQFFSTFVQLSCNENVDTTYFSFLNSEIPWFYILI